jgi:hypothetical protein
MPKLVCRIRWRRGEPLSLIKYTSVSFLDLPREIRNQIYYHVLFLPDPITVCSMHYEYTTESRDGRHSLIESITMDPIYPILAPPMLALMYCNRQVAVEATASFYNLNTFRFAGHDTWQPMYQWLSIIGAGARAQLRNLMVEVQRPRRLTQDRHGSHKFNTTASSSGSTWPAPIAQSQPASGAALTKSSNAQVTWAVMCSQYISVFALTAEPLDAPAIAGIAFLVLTS